MKVTCIVCGKEFTLGIDAVVTEEGIKCDKDAGIVRGLSGSALDAKAPSQGEYCTCMEQAGDNPRCPIHCAA